MVAAEPLRVGIGVGPGHADHGLAVALLESRFLPRPRLDDAQQRQTFAATRGGAPGGAGEARVFGAGDFLPHRRERAIGPAHDHGAGRVAGDAFAILGDRGGTRAQPVRQRLVAGEFVGKGCRGEGIVAG